VANGVTSSVKKRSSNREGEHKSNPKPKREDKPHNRMSSTTIIVLCVVVPLLLGGFANYFAHKWWILYLPLFGFLLLLGYLGHLAIRGKRSPNQLDTSKQLALSTPAPMKDDRPNKSISTINQSGGQNIIADNVKLGPAPPVPISLPNAKAELLKSMLATPTMESINFVTYDDAASVNLCDKLRYAFANWKIEGIDKFGTLLPPLEPGVTVRFGDAKQSTRVDAIVKALHDVGLPSRKLYDQSSGQPAIEVNGLKP
jgi:hypothetical protein